ncbi:MAG: uroporphyrinogen-III synthase [Caulobacterales bacterium]|nr:uroporphyrinogen-III synthase [Caulobacterales bacterium]
MRTWITRTQPGAGRTAARLAAVGLDSLVEPVLEVRALPASADVTGFEGLIFTSPNAVARFAALSSERALAVFAVGEATAEALSDAGFTDIRTAGGDVQALAHLLAARPARRLLHLAPRQPAADLAALLEPTGIEVVVRPIYETVPVLVTTALSAPDLMAVLVHSARAARTVVEQARSRLPGLHVLALSQACADPFQGVAVKSLTVAPFPDDASLVRLAHETLPKAPR